MAREESGGQVSRIDYWLQMGLIIAMAAGGVLFFYYVVFIHGL